MPDIWLGIVGYLRMDWARYPPRTGEKRVFCQAYGYKNLGETLSSWSVQQQVSRRLKNTRPVGRNRPFGISYFR